MLLSTVFLVLSIVHQIPWKFTVVVFSRDICILAVSAVLYTIAGLRDFRPSIFGKANTFAQVAAVIFVMLWQFDHVRWVAAARIGFLRATFLSDHYFGTALRVSGRKKNARAGPEERRGGVVLALGEEQSQRHTFSNSNRATVTASPSRLNRFFSPLPRQT